MKEKLTIRNFGPIKSMELELSRFNILIGEQATGKSTVAKLLAICRYFSYIVSDPQSAGAPFMEGLRQWGLDESIKESGHISYENADYLFQADTVFKAVTRVDYTGNVVKEGGNIVFTTQLKPKSENFKRLLLEFKKFSSKSDAQVGDELMVNESLSGYIPTSFYRNDVGRVMSNPFFLPTERGLQSIFSLGKNSLQNISDSLFNQLAYIDQIAKGFKMETKIDPLNISYKNVNGQGFVKKDSEEDFFSLYNAASGYQSTIPIVLAVNRYSSLDKKKTFIIEEPEMNLFPAAQQKIIQFLVQQVNDYGHSIFINTHSPYVLTSINNLLEAYKSGQEHPEETSNVIAKDLWLNPERLAVYMLFPDGSCQDILDSKERLINVEKIDAVSGELNEQFDHLLSIEFRSNEN